MCVSVGLCLGTSLCKPQQCTCGMINTRGNYGISCKRGVDRTLRHNYLNDLMYHALLQVGLPSTKEPTRLYFTLMVSCMMALPTCLGKLAIG